MEYKNRNYIDIFNPKIERLDSADSAELSLFDAGKGFELFSYYIQINSKTGVSEAYSDISEGTGVTHLIYNYLDDNKRDIVAYFTISNNVIPYDDGIDDDRNDLSNYPCITVAEIKMFAVSEKYQDVFYSFEDTDMPVSAWCLHFVIAYLEMICEEYISFQALFLHSVPTAEDFYIKNGFSPLPNYTRPLYSNDQELTAMWKVLKPIRINNSEE